MKEFVAWLFSENNSSLQIGLFDGWHFLYLAVILGGALALSLIYRNKSKGAQNKILRFFAYLTIGLYIADFFIMPLSDSYGQISVDKLPYHICTLMAVMAAFVQFNERFRRIKTPVVTLAVTSALMWMCYPGSALGGEPPFSYRIFQTFMFHGFLFVWGVLNLSLGEVELDIRKIWKEFAAILMILVWAWFGNTVYGNGQNWFFIKYSIFPFLPDEAMPVATVVGVFLVCLAIYCIYFALKKIFSYKKLQSV